MTPDREPSGAPVVAVRRTSRGPSANLALLLVATLITAAIAVALVSDPGPSPSPSAAAIVPPSAPASDAPSSAPRPSGESDSTASARTVVVLRDLEDPAQALGALTGCARLRHVGQLSPAIRGEDVDAVAARAGRDVGWIFVPPGIQAATKVWLGTDVVELALAAGESVVGIGTDGTVWLGGPAGAIRWNPIATPLGRTAWVMSGDEEVGDGACGPWALTGPVAGLRSLTCAGLAEAACLQLVPEIAAQVPAVVAAGDDLVVAVPSCIDSHRCFAAPLTVVSVPPGWRGEPGELRAASVAPATSVLAGIAANRLPDYALAAMVRPSLPLPTRRAGDAPRTCSDTIVGELRTAPWDPRVAWVGGQEVMWPTGTILQFLWLPILNVPGEPYVSYGATATEGDPVLLTGASEGGGTVFDACTLRLLPSLEEPAVTPRPPDVKGTGD